jgi:LAGLIDADG endonuclease
LAIKLRFDVSQHIRDEELLKSLEKYLACGRIELDSRGSVVKFIISKYSDIVEKLIPFLQEYPLQGSKLADYKDFCEVAELMKSKAHLTKEGLEKILKIKAGMNTARVVKVMSDS